MRITAGLYRSRVLVAPRGDATRPTSDRVREALFSILSARITFEGARVLDLYAGTGALGLEALSRGAASATFVEKGRDALAALRKNIDALALRERCRILARAVEGGAELSGPFDLVFADPPYADVQSGEATRAVERVLAGGGLAEGGLLVLEHASKTAAPEVQPLGAPYDTRVYGDTAVSFYM